MNKTSIPDHYYDRVLGGWLGKCIGGTIGARFEGNKNWIEVPRDQLFPESVPPNDDLDLQILWLKVIEEKGIAITADDLAEAWMEFCWYPFNEYGNFRRNFSMGIHPPLSGTFDNDYWITGMGCPIRAEIWGYVFAGAPDLADRYSRMDGGLDHGSESVGAEAFFAAMAAEAFFESDIRVLIEKNLFRLHPGGDVFRGVRAALNSFDRGITLKQARENVLLVSGHPEGCDARTNVPFTVLSLVYGGGDMEETLRASLACGYDTDCTMATAAALVGQILGAGRIPSWMREKIGDELVVGIAYNRPEPKISALARDTVQAGLDLRVELEQARLSRGKSEPGNPFEITYEGQPSLAPGESISATLKTNAGRGSQFRIQAPAGWMVVPDCLDAQGGEESWKIRITARPEVKTLPHSNLFHVVGERGEREFSFGVCGATVWRLIAARFDVLDPLTAPCGWHRAMLHTFADLGQCYLPEPEIPVEQAWHDICQSMERPPVFICRERTLHPSEHVGLVGTACLYFERQIFSPTEREVHVVVGHSEPFRLFLNGVPVGESREHLWWTPYNATFKARLRKGENSLVLKWIRTDPNSKFFLDFKSVPTAAKDPGQHFLDWDTDLEEGISWLGRCAVPEENRRCEVPRELATAR
ncbi:MAG: ADP-ribosylglycohydrolase family protein [Terrimicrobiaceae bacterium]